MKTHPWLDSILAMTEHLEKNPNEVPSDEYILALTKLNCAVARAVRKDSNESASPRG